VHFVSEAIFTTKLVTETLEMLSRAFQPNLYLKKGDELALWKCGRARFMQ